MTKRDKKRILRMVLADLAAFGVLSYLVCAQVFRFFPWRPVEIVIPAQEASVPEATAVPEETAEPTAAPAHTPAPSASGEESTPSTTEQTPAPTATPEPTDTPAPEPEGLLKGKFAEKFSAEVVSTDTAYRSENVAIELEERTGYVCATCGHTADAAGACPFCGFEIANNKNTRMNYTFADIYLQDISSLRTAYAAKATETDRVKPMSEANNGILAVNTDYFLNAYSNKHGWFYRNGVEIQRFNKITADLCVLYADGTMETIETKNKAVNFDGIAAKTPLQMWYFGPALLDEAGASKTKFNSSLGKANPRTVVGYYEPGHYCFFVVNGRNGERGLTFEELSLLCADLGLKAAYNMDGGASSALYFNGKVYGPNGRDTSDIVYIAEPIKENE